MIELSNDLRTLPPKDSKEEEKHLREYKEMMKVAKRKGQSKSDHSNRSEQERIENEKRKKEAREKTMRQSLAEWESSILPFYEKK